MLWLAALGVFNLFYICLISDGLMPTMPTFFVLAFVVLMVTIYYQIEGEYKTVDKDDVGNIVMLIQLKRSQSLVEALELKPEVLNQKYKRKSLIEWTKYYQNHEAHSIIIKQMSLHS